MKTFILLQLLTAVVAIIILTGCGGSTGWRFEVGVSPVKELSNTAGIKQETDTKVKY